MWAFDPSAGQWDANAAKMNYSITEHCSVKVDRHRVMIIGGAE